MSWTTKTRKQIALWATKTDKDPKELFDQLQAIYEKLEETRKGMAIEVLERLARVQLGRRLKTPTSPAIPFEGIFVGCGSLFIWRPTDDQGNVTREVPFRTAVAIGRPAEPGKDIKMIILRCSNEQAHVLPPRGTPVSFMGILKEDKETKYIVNSSTKTEYEPTKMAEFPEVDEDIIIRLLQGAPTKSDATEWVKASVEELAEFHEEFGDDRTRVVVVEGDAFRIRRQPTSVGNYLVVLQDFDALEDMEAPDIPCWIHEDIADMIDHFGQGSRVIVLGRTTMSDDRIMIDTYGIWSIPEFRIAPDEESLFEPETEINLDGGARASH